MIRRRGLVHAPRPRAELAIGGMKNTPEDYDLPVYILYFPLSRVSYGEPDAERKEERFPQRGFRSNDSNFVIPKP